MLELETLFAAFCGMKHCILISNGTVAIHLVLVVMNIGPRDEVLVTNLIFVGTANAVGTSSATPVFVDVCKRYMVYRSGGRKTQNYFQDESHYSSSYLWFSC